MKAHRLINLAPVSRYHRKFEYRFGAQRGHSTRNLANLHIKSLRLSLKNNQTPTRGHLSMSLTSWFNSRIGNIFSHLDMRFTWDSVPIWGSYISSPVALTRSPMLFRAGPIEAAPLSLGDLWIANTAIGQSRSLGKDCTVIPVWLYSTSRSHPLFRRHSGDLWNTKSGRYGSPGAATAGESSTQAGNPPHATILGSSQRVLTKSSELSSFLDHETYALFCICSPEWVTETITTRKSGEPPSKRSFIRHHGKMVPDVIQRPHDHTF